MSNSGKPIVIAHHLIFTAYGWWLPNDPRGSGSNLIHNDPIAELGELHHGRKSLQPAGRDVAAFYAQASEVLAYPLRRFDEAQISMIADAFADVIAERKYTCYACAIMADHVHLCIRKHRDTAEEMMEHLKALSRKRLRENGGFASDHPVWVGGLGWKVFLDHPKDVRRTIGYINRNPRSRQRWPFVIEYNDWPLHEGHSPNSPYARALKRAGRYP